MGLLDSLFTDDPRKQAQLAMALGLLGGQGGKGFGGFARDLGSAGLLGMNQFSRANEEQRRSQRAKQDADFRAMQAEQMKSAQADQSYARQVAPQFFNPGNAPADGMGPTLPQKADFQGYGMALAARNPSMGLPYIQAGMKDSTPLTVKEGETLLDRNTMQPVYKSAAKPHWVDAGDSVIPVGPDGTPVGPPIKKNMAPGEAQRIGMEGQRLGMDRARLGMEAGRYNYEVGTGQGLPQKAQDAIKADIGKKQAEATLGAQQELPQVEAEAQQVTGLVDKLVTHPGFKTSVGVKGPSGMVANINPQLAAGTDAADWMVLRDQIVGKQFMQAYQTLKGGGQITEVEGKKATDAIARMNTAQSEKAFTEAANEFKSVINAGLARTKKKAGSGGWSIQRVN